MRTDLKRLVEFVDEMKSTSSTNAKKEIIQKYDSPFLRKIFEYTYSPFKQYGVTSENLIRRSDLRFDNYGDDLFALLDDLSERRITGHFAIQCVNGFVARFPGLADIIYDVIDRNIKTRATATLINSVLPGTVPTFDVALAEKFDPEDKKIDFENQRWFASRKLDGVRCLAFFDETGEVKFFSRQGKEFHTLSKLAGELKRLNIRSAVLDGEVCIMHDNELEDFQGILKEIGRKDHTVEKPMFYIFDMIQLSDFENGKSSTTLTERLTQLGIYFIGVNLTMAAPLAQLEIEHRDHLEELIADATDLGYEGIMLRKDVIYEGKRSKNLLKVKKMQDAEYAVVGLENGIHRIIENGKEVEEEMLKAVFIEHMGNRVRVGSGFSIFQRRQYFKNPEDIMSKVITVQYFEQTTDQDGNHSLRFPVLKAVHGEKREL
jgi:DNA ligase-1